ncbi:putative metal chaperone YciC [Paenibacillus sp. P1XP2]|nr:putative metal chaperone YciC [Paenibacillus sp. P1XP2]
MNTGLFDFEKASMSAGWIQELEKDHHTPETEEYGIGSFVYRKRAPFHPERLAAMMADWPAEVVRAKGLVWLAVKDDVAASFSQAGPSIQFGCGVLAGGDA